MTVVEKRIRQECFLNQEFMIESMLSLEINLVHLPVAYRHFLVNGREDFETIHNIPHKLLQLIESIPLLSSRLVSLEESNDKSTTKLLIEMQDKTRIETVIMRYGDVALDSFEKLALNPRDQSEYTFKSNKRATVCVSSQVGCAMGCTFCGICRLMIATGTMNLQGNLFDYEIVEQLFHANQHEKIRNVVFMGMGEPLDNYSNVLNAIKVMIDNRYFSLSPSKVTISTVGVVPRLIQLKKDLPQIGLALSLHAPTQEMREIIVPTSKAWRLDKIMEATESFINNQNRKKAKKRHVLIEYVLIQKVNSSPDTAHKLGQLLKDKNVLLNVIPYNKTAVPYDYSPPTKEECAEFVDIVRSYGHRVLFRQELGGDIASACGQLVIESKKSCGSGDIEDLGRVKKGGDGVKKERVKSIKVVGKKTEDFKEIKIQEGNLEKNIPQILIQYSILGLVIYGTTRYMFKLWS